MNDCERKKKNGARWVTQNIYPATTQVLPSGHRQCRTKSQYASKHSFLESTHLRQHGLQLKAWALHLNPGVQIQTTYVLGYYYLYNGDPNNHLYHKELCRC